MGAARRVAAGRLDRFAPAAEETDELTEVVGQRIHDGLRADVGRHLDPFTSGPAGIGEGAVVHETAGAAELPMPTALPVTLFARLGNLAAGLVMAAMIALAVALRRRER